MDMDRLSQQIASIKMQQPLHLSTYCNIKPGDVVNNLVAVAELGTGRFSAVWAMRNTDGTLIAVKVYRCGSSNSEYFKNEVRVLNTLLHYAYTTQRALQNVLPYYGSFAHVTLGHDLAPRIHPCLTFACMGDHVGRLIRHYRKEYDEGLPLPCVRKIMRGVFTGLANMHRAGLIHTDIKPENVLMTKRVNEIRDESDIEVCIADLGSATPANDLFSRHVGTVGYEAPELLLELDYTIGIDIWAAFAMCYELITGTPLFDVDAEHGIKYGADVDEALAEYENERAQKEVENPRDENMDSGSESDDTAETAYRHLMLITKVIGHAPRSFWEQGRTYYNARGKLKNNPDIEPTPIHELLMTNYEMERNDALEIEQFLLLGLRYNPEQRISAEQALQQPWLNKE